MPEPRTTADAKTAIADELAAVRRRSLDLLAPLGDDDLYRQHSPLMSPLVWDLGHVGNYEEQWLLRAVGGVSPIDPALDDVYDAFRHPRPGRPSLPLLGPAAARRYLDRVRGGVLDTLDRISLDEPDGLTGDGFVYGMVIQHEHQHNETMLATLQLMDGVGYRPLALAPPRGDHEADDSGHGVQATQAGHGVQATQAGHGVQATQAGHGVQATQAGEVRISAGPFTMGTDADPWAYDNERPAHVVDLPEFWIDAYPVTNRRYLEFVDDGGYDERQWWSDEGWSWRQQAGLEHPEFWRREGEGSWSRLRFGWREDLPLDEPVQHVCWHEACAFAAWAGRRLPTEAEWEKAAVWDPASSALSGSSGPGGLSRSYPWGEGEPTPDRANLAQRHFRPAPVGAYPAGASASGCQQMLGDVWEWTASEFGPYPGFRSHPYREYSEVFFDSGYKVLRGGSWATHPLAIRTTFRNWDFPIRRQIFAGFRCARDA